MLNKTAKKYQSGLQTELQEMFHSATMEKVRARRDAILADYSDVAEEVMRCLEEGFESAMTVMHLDEYLRRYYRTSNHLERLNKELKRRSKVIGISPTGTRCFVLWALYWWSTTTPVRQRERYLARKITRN